MKYYKLCNTDNKFFDESQIIFQNGSEYIYDVEIKRQDGIISYQSYYEYKHKNTILSFNKRLFWFDDYCNISQLINIVQRNYHSIRYIKDYTYDTIKVLAPYNGYIMNYIDLKKFKYKNTQIYRIMKKLIVADSGWYKFYINNIHYLNDTRKYKIYKLVLSKLPLLLEDIKMESFNDNQIFELYKVAANKCGYAIKFMKWLSRLSFDHIKIIYILGAQSAGGSVRYMDLSFFENDAKYDIFLFAVTNNTYSYQYMIKYFDDMKLSRTKKLNIYSEMIKKNIKWSFDYIDQKFFTNPELYVLFFSSVQYNGLQIQDIQDILNIQLGIFSKTQIYNLYLASVKQNGISIQYFDHLLTKYSKKEIYEIYYEAYSNDTKSKKYFTHLKLLNQDELSHFQ